jgi:hypothetical protein
VFLKKLQLTASAHICEHRINTIFVDQTQGGAADTQTNPAVFAFNPETAILQIREKTAFGFVVGVRNIVPNHRAFARYFAYTCHDVHFFLFQNLTIQKNRTSLNQMNIAFKLASGLRFLALHLRTPQET